MIEYHKGLYEKIVPVCATSYVTKEGDGLSVTETVLWHRWHKLQARVIRKGNGYLEHDATW